MKITFLHGLESRFARQQNIMILKHYRQPSRFMAGLTPWFPLPVVYFLASA